MNVRRLHRDYGLGLGIGTLLVVALAGSIWWLNVRGEFQPIAPDPTSLTSTRLAERGTYLALAGNCAGCHTARGGAPYAGGEGIATPFGTVYAGNLTPDGATGIGTWSEDDFWRALHNGRSKNGRLLYPVFPYPNTTRITRADSDALHAFLQTRAPVQRPNRAHELQFPYDTQLALALWRAMYFRPGVFEPHADQSRDWNRGAYLVRGLGHCDACHGSRNALGASNSALELGGGVIPLQNWYAPSLARADEAGGAERPLAQVVQLLQTGTTAQGSVLGPMAEVVWRSTQHLHADDLRSMATFLQALPQGPTSSRTVEIADPATLSAGRRVYDDHCASCHGDQGQGARGAYPPLAGNRSVTMDVSTNVVRVIVEGGFAPATAGNPRPYGMPPFGSALTRAEIAAVATYIRNDFGNRARPVSEVDVILLR
ncbi:MAG: cytochrome c [Rubrivivax sp.]